MPRKPGHGRVFWALALWVATMVSLTGAANRKTSRPTNSSAPPPIESALLMEADTGTVLYEKDIHQQRAPASMVKLLLMLIVMEQVQSGALHLSDPITASAHASHMGGSQIYLRAGEVFPLETMMKAIVVASANDASVAVAEHIAGSVEDFVELMNARATALHLSETHVATVHGLPPSHGDPGDLTSAYDLAVLARELVKYPEILQWGAIREESIRDGKFILTNTNKLVYTFPGVDGLKTGYHHGAGFNVTAAAQRHGVRWIAVVMGAHTSAACFDEAKRLLAMGFNSYHKVVIVRKDAPIGPAIQVSGSTVRRIRAVAENDLAVVVKKGAEKSLVTDVQVPPRLDAPAHRGQVIGEVRVTQQDQTLASTAAVIPEDIPQVGLMWRLFGR